jgi:hypothetical protein
MSREMLYPKSEIDCLWVLSTKYCPGAGWMLLMFLVSGCSKGNLQETYPVSGIVQWSNGQAAIELTGGMVAFEAIDRSKNHTFPVGAVQSDGTFILKTYQPGDGAPEGKYKVAIMPERNRDIEVRQPPSVMDPKFENYMTSGLEVTIKPEVNQLKLTVERASKR